ncbi:MAG: hypothetical protein OXF39_03490 [Nitrospira sp.]|nr:hypothetical protein [Nitrospira sp.]
MFSFIRFSFMLSCVLFLLTACGGGGGGGMPPMNGVPSGDGESRLTPTEVRSAIAEIGQTANTLIMSDLQSTPRSRIAPNERVSANCRGSYCEPEPSWSEPGYSVAELSVIVPDATIRIGAPQYGVNVAEVSGRTSYRAIEEDEDWSVDYRVYGGWLSNSFFGVERGRWRGRAQYGSIDGLEALIAYSAGDASGSNPVTGSAEWTGLVVALDRTAPDQAVQGKAALTYDFGDNTLDALFSNLRGSRTYGDLSWTDLAVTNGRFSQGSGANSIDGTFYGDTHEEAGGVFERSNLVGAFGATR